MDAAPTYNWQGLPSRIAMMATMNISLTDDLREFVEQQVRDKSYTSSSEYLRQLIREHREIERFRELIDEGANSPIVGVFDQSYFDDLKRSIRKGRIE